LEAYVHAIPKKLNMATSFEFFDAVLNNGLHLWKPAFLLVAMLALVWAVEIRMKYYTPFSVSKVTS
jgi:hypothetical protein